MVELSLEQRIQRLEDLENIRNVTFKYAHYINQGWASEKVEVEKIGEIFSDDIIGESPDMKQKIVGIKNIKESLAKETEHLKFAMHAYLNPEIIINENEASGKWLFWIVSIPKENLKNQVYMSQEIKYLRIENSWKICHIKLYFGSVVQSSNEDIIKLKTQNK
jgi:hypothetical protein